MAPLAETENAHLTGTYTWALRIDAHGRQTQIAKKGAEENIAILGEPPPLKQTVQKTIRNYN